MSLYAIIIDHNDRNPPTMLQKPHKPLRSYMSCQSRGPGATREIAKIPLSMFSYQLGFRFLSTAGHSDTHSTYCILQACRLSYKPMCHTTSGRTLQIMQLGPEEGALPGLQRGVVLDYHTSRARQRLWAAGF